MKAKKNGTINLLRIIAASLLVLYYHQEGTKIDFLPIAFYGGVFDFSRIVELFFLIFGLRMYKSVSRIDEESDFVVFWKKKTVGLYPILFFTVLAEFVLRKISESIVGGGTYTFGLFDLLINMLGLQQLGVFATRAVNGPTWFLSALFFCYFLFYVSTKYSRRKKVSPYWAYAVIIFIAAAVLSHGWDTMFINHSLARGALSFFVGILLGRYLFETKKAKWENAVICMPLLFVFLLWRHPGMVQGGLDFLYTIMMWIPLVTLAVSWNPRRLAENETIALMGSAAFSVYLWNEPLACLRGILKQLMGLRVDTWGFLFIFFIINWVVGIASYCYLEKPLTQVFSKKIMRDKETKETIA